MTAYWSFLEPKRFEFLNLFGDGPLRRKSLHARGSKEARDAARPAQYIDDIVRLGQRPAVADHQDLRVDRHRDVADGLDERHSLIEREGRPGADGSLGGQPRVGDDDVRSRLCQKSEYCVCNKIAPIRK